MQNDFEKSHGRRKRAYKKIRNKTSGKKTFKGVFERDEKVLTEIFKNVERPVLSNENLIKWGVKTRMIWNSLKN